MGNEEKNPRVPITTKVGLDLWKLAKEKGIAWSDALEVGIKTLAKKKKKK